MTLYNEMDTCTNCEGTVYFAFVKSYRSFHEILII